MLSLYLASERRPAPSTADHLSQRIINSILSTPPSSSLPSADLTNLNHLRSFHESCLDENLIDRQGLAPLLDVVKEVVGAWRGESAGGLVQQVSGMEWIAKKGKGRWDKETRKDRLTAALMFLHSRGPLRLSLARNYRANAC